MIACPKNKKLNVESTTVQLHFERLWEIATQTSSIALRTRAIVRRPAFVVADEAVSALDMTVQAQVLDLFGDLQQRHGFSCLFITHALSVVRRIAHRVAVMKDGRIVETAETEELFARPRHDYTRALLAAAPVLEPAAGGGWRLAGPANDRSAL